MSSIDTLVSRNRARAAAGAHEGLTMRPRLGSCVLTCLDPRVEPASFLGLSAGDAVVLRNAGGRVTPEVQRDLAVMTELARGPRGPEDRLLVAVVHHSQCGTAALADAAFRQRVADSSGDPAAALVALAVTDPARSVRTDVARLRAHPVLGRRLLVVGLVYDVVSGLLEVVDVPEAAA